MKLITKIIISLFLAAAFSLSAKELKVLTIGNSFADSVFDYLPQIAAQFDDCQLTLERANHPGCELDRHWSYVEKEEADPSAKMYRNNTQTLRGILASRPWDFITIQQASHKSWRPETYMPYAKNLRDYAKKYAPQAEVLMQQTWAYVQDDGRISEGGAWGFDQNGMYQRLTKAYAKAAKELNLRLIPTGYAVQKARKTQGERERPLPDGKYPQHIEFTDDFVGAASFVKDNKGDVKMHADTIHLNTRGKYLQACLWFAFMFDKPAAEIKFKPATLSDEDAAFIRKTVDDTLKEFKQPRDI